MVVTLSEQFDQPMLGRVHGRGMVAEQDQQDRLSRLVGSGLVQNVIVPGQAPFGRQGPVGARDNRHGARATGTALSVSQTAAEEEKQTRRARKR